MCQQAKLILVGLFGILFNNVIYATDCSLDKAFGDILSDVTAGKVTTHRASSMDVKSEDVILIRENPLQADYEVWKVREQFRSADYRSRRKTAGDENKLKACDRTADKTTLAEDKMKDKPIEYSFIDEYCKVSAPKPSDELDSRPRELKTNTAFGRSKMPFDKFARTHIGGDSVDCTLTRQPVSAKNQLDTRIRSVQRNCETVQEARDYGYGSNDDVSLRCCGHNVETAVDYCTCIFCVKALFYHCGKDSDEDSDLGKPFSCSPVNCGCVKRWSVIGLFALILPCLLCYPAAKGCVEVCKCYKKSERSVKREQNRTVQNQERERLNT